MAGRTAAVTAGLLLSLALAGCWDRREIEERNTVLAVGADLCSSGKPACMTLTRQIVIPGRVPMGGRSSQAPRAKTVDVVITEGKDDIDASGKAQGQLPRDMHFGHIRMFVLGEELARTGLQKYMNWVHGLPEQGYLEWFAIAEGKAGDVIGAHPRMEPLPALYLFNMLSNAHQAGRLPRVFLSDFQITLANGGEDPVVPLIAMAAADRPAIAGLAVFQGATMVGRLTPDETITYMQLRGYRRGSEILNIQLPGGHEADLRVRQRMAAPRVKAIGPQLAADFQLTLEADLFRLSAPLHSQDPEVIRLIEQEAAEQVRNRAEALAAKVQQELQADVLAVGQHVRAFLPAAWAALGDWRSAYPQVQIHVRVQVHVRRTGMTSH